MKNSYRGSFGASRWWGRLIFVTCLSIAGGPAQAQSLADAVREIEAKNFAQAAEWLLPLANQGDTDAQYRLGLLAYHGQGMQEDEVMAVYWWKKAAQHGHAESMYQLANAYLFGAQAGKFVADPDREAALWYFQSASAGHLDAQYHLGLLFLAGKGVVESRKEAARWFRMAADKGHGEAKKALESVEPRPGKRSAR